MQLKPSPPEIPETPEIDSRKAGKHHSGNSGKSLDYRSPELPRDSPSFAPAIEVVPGQTRILLSEAASRHLSDQGAECFQIVTKAMHPDKAGRWVIHLVPCSLKTARAAEGVLLGTHSARRVRAIKHSRD